MKIASYLPQTHLPVFKLTCHHCSPSTCPVISPRLLLGPPTWSLCSLSGSLSVHSAKSSCSIFFNVSVEQVSVLLKAMCWLLLLYGYRSKHLTWPVRCGGPPPGTCPLSGVTLPPLSPSQHTWPSLHVLASPPQAPSGPLPLLFLLSRMFLHSPTTSCRSPPALY